MSVNLPVPGAPPVASGFQRTYENANDVPPATPAPPDDEFESVGVDLTRWTLFNCVEGAVDPLGTPAQNTVQQVGNGFLYMQGAAGGGTFGLRQDYTLADDRALVIKAHLGGNFQTGVVDNGHTHLRITLNDDDANHVNGISYRTTYGEVDGTQMDNELIGQWGTHERRVGHDTGVNEGKGFGAQGMSWYTRHDLFDLGATFRLFHFRGLNGVAFAPWEERADPIGNRPDNIWILSQWTGGVGRTVSPIVVYEFVREGTADIPTVYGP